MHYTNLNRFRGYCDEQQWGKLLSYLGKTEADDEPLALATILMSNGLDDAILALDAIDDCPEVIIFRVRCCREIQHLMTDTRSVNALDVSEMYAVGEATQAELDAARDAAWAAVSVDTWDAVSAAASAAVSADTWDAVSAAVSAAAWAAVSAAAWAAASAAARDDAWDAAWDDAIQKQQADFIAIFCQPDDEADS